MVSFLSTVRDCGYNFQSMICGKRTTVRVNWVFLFWDLLWFFFILTVSKWGSRFSAAFFFTSTR